MYIKGILRIVETDKKYPDEGDFVIHEDGNKTFYERGDFLQGNFKVFDVYISKETGERIVEHIDFNENLRGALTAYWGEDEEGFNDGREFVVHVKYLPTENGWQEKVVFKKWRYSKDGEVKAHIYPWSVKDKLVKLHGRMESPEEYELNEEDTELFNNKFKKDERPRIFAEGIRTCAKIALDKIYDLKHEGKTDLEIIQALHEHFSNIYKDQSEITQ